jgi:hypothetical protein
MRDECVANEQQRRVSTLPTSTTNITGFFIISARIELAHASSSAGADLSVPKTFILPWSLFLRKAFLPAAAGVRESGPGSSAGKKVSAPTDQDHASQQHVNSGVFTGKVPGDGGTLFFCARLPASASTGTSSGSGRPASPAQRHVVPVRVGVQPRKGRAVVAHRRGEGVENLVKPMRALLFRLLSPRFGISTKTA